MKTKEVQLLSVKMPKDGVTSIIHDSTLETQTNISEDTEGSNENLSTLQNDLGLSLKMDDLKRGLDNPTFLNDACEAERPIQKKGSSSSQKLVYANIHKTPPTNHNDRESQLDTEIDKSTGNAKSSKTRRNLSEDTSSVHAEQRAKYKEERTEETERRQEIEDGNVTIEVSRKTDDITAAKGRLNMEEEEEEDDEMETEPADMLYALARGSIDVRGSVFKKPKLSKTKKAFILFSCFFMQLCLGLLFSLGILYVELMETFRSTRSVTSLVQSLPLGLSYMLGLIVGPLIQKLGLRVSIFCGGLLTGVGFIASSFVSNINAIIILVGVVGGTGVSLFNIGSYASIPFYFGKKQRIAVAFTSFGTGVGAMLWPLISRVLLKHFGWRGNMLITGGIVLNVCSLSLFFKPPPVRKEEKVLEKAKKSKTSMRKNLLQLMKMPMFVGLMFWSVLDGLSSPIVSQMIVDFSRVNKYGKDIGASLLVYYSLSNAVGRAVVGIISRFKIPSFLFFAFASLLCGAAFFLLGFTDVYWKTLAVLIVAGFMLGAHVAFNMIVLLKIVGPDMYGLSWGLCATCLGIGFSISGPVAGFISQLKSYNFSFYVAGLTIFIDMIIYGTVIIICKCKNRKKS